jgi:nonsense-mediated mRNA decay protein 3
MEIASAPAQNVVTGTLPIMLCCMCGVAMQTNPANTCAQCLQSQHDVTQGILKSEIICKCRGCDRYQRDATGWLDCHRESRELLAFCLKKIKGLKTAKLVDAVFVWTEPHSKRVKVKLTVQKEVVNGVLLQQSCVVEFVEQNRMCEECHRAEGNEVSTWNTVIQVRQKVNHKRTFLFLEQLILKHNACDRTLKIDPQPNGVDFYFTTTGNAVRFHDFLQSVIPVSLYSARCAYLRVIYVSTQTFLVGIW